MFIYFFGIVPAFYVDVVVVEKLLLYVWDVSWFDSLVNKSIPIEVFEPWVLLDLLVTINSKSFSWLSQKTPVHKVCSILVITLWNIFSSNLSLFVYDCFSNFFSASAKIWSSSYDTFISNNANCKIICSNAVILFEHNFWRHVSWSSTIFSAVFRCPLSCNSKIS